MKKTICMVLILMMLSTLTVSASDGNIAQGLPYTIEFGENCDDSYRLFAEDGEKFDIDTQNLTDGMTGGLYKAYRCGSRLICFDFGAEKTFTGYGGIFSVQDGGVYAPHYMRLWLFADGIDYACVHVKDPNASEPEIPSASDFPIISIVCVGATLLMAIAAVIIVKKTKKGK